MPKQVRSWAGVSPEDRRAERRVLLLDAAFDLLGTEGSAATTVRAVCAAAQLNPRYFYESFADLDELLVAVYDRLGEELAEAVAKAVASAPPDQQVRVVVERTVRFVDEDRRRGRVLYHEALGNETLNRRRLESSFALADLIAGGSKDRQVAASFVVGGFSEVLMAWLDGRITVSRTRLIDQTTDLFLSIGR
ncbi:MAG TPA: TetR/AcrR family transcriptional regulator [Acidimicrobiales bacterium]|nr:TetR/AcrR family transcriptional regulator [Acidimicrobiales bacterium]